jgi:hypothetical protein
MTGLIGTAASAIFELVKGHYFVVSKWNTFLTGSISVEYRMFLIFEVLEYIFIACYAVFCFILMLKKRDILPKYIMGFYISTPAFFIVSYIIASGLKFDSSNLSL